MYIQSEIKKKQTNDTNNIIVGGMNVMLNKLNIKKACNIYKRKWEIRTQLN